MRAFAKDLGLEEAAYRRYEADETEPPMEVLLRMCRLLKTTPNFLLTGDKNFDPQRAA